MPEIKVTPLGAGQDVGRSCLLVNIGSKNIMLDCGMHMGFQGRTNSEVLKLIVHIRQTIINPLIGPHVLYKCFGI